MVTRYAEGLFGVLGGAPIDRDLLSGGFNFYTESTTTCDFSALFNVHGMFKLEQNVHHIFVIVFNDTRCSTATDFSIYVVIY